MFNSSLVWCPASEQGSEMRVKGDAILALILPTIAVCLRRACVAFALATLEVKHAPRDPGPGAQSGSCLWRQYVANVAVQSGPQHGDMLPGTPVTSLPIGGNQWRQERHYYVLNTTDVSKMRSSGPPRAATGLRPACAFGFNPEVEMEA